MNCQEFWNTMPELAPEEDGHLDHVRECPACAALLNRQRTLALGLRTLAADWRSVAAPARVESRLAAAFPGLGGPAVLHPAARWWAPVVTWAVATAAVLALAMFLARGRQVVAPVHRTTSNRIQLAAAELPADLETPGDPADVESEFIPLPNAARIEPNEDLNLVRVEVPRSAMIALGYVVSEDRASEPVEAEVVLGADGLARAVRFFE